MVRVFYAGLIGLLLSMAAMAEERVVLVTEHVEVTTQDVKGYAFDRLNSGTPPETVYSPSGLKQIIENAMIFKTLAKQAVDEGIVFNDDMQLQLDLYKQRLLYQALVDKRVNEALAKTDWEALAREQYLANPEAFKRPAEVNVAHVLIATKTRSDEEAKAMAERVLELAKKGDDFNELASTYSEDPSAANNRGELGFFPRGTMVREFDAMAFSMEKAGDISDLVKTRYGYHILKLNAKREAGVRSFDEVKAGIIDERKKLMPQEIRNALQLQARSPAKLELNEEVLKDLETSLLGAATDRNSKP